MAFIPTLQQSMYNTFIREIKDKEILPSYSLIHIQLLEDHDNIGVACRIECHDRRQHTHQWEVMLVPYMMSDACLRRFNYHIRGLCQQYRVEQWRAMEDDDLYDFLLIDDWYFYNFYVVLDKY